MRILGIETSCDETAVAVIDVRGRLPSPRIRVLANVVASQVKLHVKFGGVVPHLAKREHQRNLASVLLAALRDSGLLKPKIKNQKPKTQTKKQKTLSHVRYTLSAILEREPDLFARMVPEILTRPAPKIDAIAVTVGPGLAPALWVGVNFARALSYLWKKPLIPVNHLEGHIYTNLLPQIRVKSKFPAWPAGRQISNSKTLPNPYPLTPIPFPALCLIVSGGHTELVLMSGYGKYRMIGETLDDAAGEAFDKVAKMLGLGFPGGPAIAAETAKIQNAKIKMQNDNLKSKIKLPRPMINSPDYNFSFSGLKTAVLYLLRDLTKKYPLRKIRPWVAEEFQNAVVDVLVAKTVRAARQFRVKTVMIGGGVAANKKLRHELGAALARSLPATRYLVPDTRLTGDNALMIALAGWFNRVHRRSWRSVLADANLRLDVPRK